MLAPLKDRSILHHDHENNGEPALSSRRELEEEIVDLRRALRESRQRLRRGAWRSARQMALLHGEINRLQALYREQNERLERYLSGVAIIELGQALMRQTENNERLKGAARRVGFLEQSLESTEEQCRRLTAERNQLAARIAAQATDTSQVYRHE